jgi:hypothetical protein
MNFAYWTRALSARGLTLVALTHSTPIQVCVLAPDGGLIMFKCRGTRVTMERFPATALLVAAPAAGRGCECGRSHGDDPVDDSAAPRYIVPVGARPAQVVEYDGRAERGWSGHEAGLLSPDDAAPLFDALWARLHGGHAPADGLDAWVALDARRRGWTQRAGVRTRRQGLAGSSL